MTTCHLHRRPSFPLSRCTYPRTLGQALAGCCALQSMLAGKSGAIRYDEGNGGTSQALERVSVPRGALWRSDGALSFAACTNSNNMEPALGGGYSKSQDCKERIGFTAAKVAIAADVGVTVFRGRSRTRDTGNNATVHRTLRRTPGRSRQCNGCS